MPRIRHSQYAHGFVDSNYFMKPNKSILKRIRITKTGKLVRRRAGQDHFNAKESGRSQQRKRGAAPFMHALAREVRQRV